MLERNRMWERACSRMRCISQPVYQLTDRIREQACSHMLIVTSCFFSVGKLPLPTAEYFPDPLSPVAKLEELSTHFPMAPAVKYQQAQ